MKTGSKVMLAAVGMMFCFGMTVGLPMTHAAEAKSAKTVTSTSMSKAKKTHKHAAMSKAEVKKVQEVLIKDGAKIKADGIMGKHTRAAIKAFQKKNNLKVTGRLDKETMEKLK